MTHEQLLDRIESLASENEDLATEVDDLADELQQLYAQVASLTEHIKAYQRAVQPSGTSTTLTYSLPNIYAQLAPTIVLDFVKSTKV